MVVYGVASSFDMTNNYRNSSNFIIKLAKAESNLDCRSKMTLDDIRMKELKHCIGSREKTFIKY